MSLDDLKRKAEQSSWDAINKFFDGGKNGPQVKVACTVIAVLAKEKQAKNAERSIELVERRLALGEERMVGVDRDGHPRLLVNAGSNGSTKVPS